VYVTAGTLSVSGSITANAVNVQSGGTLGGYGTITANTNLSGSGIIDFGVIGNIVGSLTVAGGNWNGQGTVSGTVSVNSGTFNLGPIVGDMPASLTTGGGLNVSGTAALSSSDATSTINGSINYTSSATSTFAGNVLGSGSVTVNTPTANQVPYSNASFYSVFGYTIAGGQLTLSGNTLYTGATNVTNGTLTLNNGLSGSGGTINIGAWAVLQAGGLVSRPVTTTAPGAGYSGIIQAVSPLILANFSGPFNFYGMLDVQSTSVEIVTGTPVYSQLSFINLNNGGYLTSGSGIVMPSVNSSMNGGPDGTPGDNTQGLVTVSGTATIGGYIQFGLVHGDSVTFFGLTGSDAVNFTGTIHGLPTSTNVFLNYANAVNLIGFSPTFNPTVGSTLSASANTLYVGTNVMYTPAPAVNTLLPTAIAGNPASVSNYSQYLAYGYTQITNGTLVKVGSIIIPVSTASGGTNFTYSNSPGLTSYYPTESLYFIRTDGHMWANTTITSGLNSKGIYQFTDGTIVGFSNVSLANFAGLPGGLGAGLSWQVESTSAYLRLYVQGVVPSGSGVWQNGAGDSNWSTNTSANSNWLGTGGQPSSVGQIATFDATVVNYNGGVVNVDKPQTIGGIVLNNSGQGSGGYTLSGSTLTLTNANIVGGVVTYTDPTITVNSGTHAISDAVIIGNGAVGQTNGLAVTVAASSQLTLSGIISSGYNTGNNLSVSGGGTLNLNAVNTYTGGTTVNASATLGGTGTIPGATSVFGTIRGGVSDGTNNWGTLTIGSGSSILQAGGTLLTEVSRTGVNTANASLIKLTAGTFNLDPPITFNISLLNNGVNDLPLQNGETYTITLVQVASSGNILLNGVSQGANAQIPAGDYTLSASPTMTFSSYSLAIDSSGDLLQLTFTPGSPTPEPEHIMLLSVGVLLVGLAIRRRWRRQVSAASVA
jgi:autotransporter-associated beta strand protein